MSITSSKIFIINIFSKSSISHTPSFKAGIATYKPSNPVLIFCFQFLFEESWGSQSQLPYSKIGRTSSLYAISFTSWGQNCNFSKSWFIKAEIGQAQLPSPKYLINSIASGPVPSISKHNLQFLSVFTLQNHCLLHKSAKWGFRIWLTVANITKTRLFKYIQNFTSRNWKFSDKNSDFFSHFYSKHRFWVLVRTASARRF